MISLAARLARPEVLELPRFDISANANAEFGRTAIGANLRGGQLVTTVGEAQAYG